jgi:hypothetical protein
MRTQTHKSLRLTEADFEAGSSARARQELRQRTLAWARGVAARLQDLGISVEPSASGQRVLFSLGHARHPGPEHVEAAFLALRIDLARVEVSIEVAPEASADVRNLRARLSDPGLALELVSALEALPEQFAIGLAADEPRTRLSAQVAGASEIRGLCDKSAAEGSALWIGWSVPRAIAVRHSAALGEQLEDALVALGAVYKLVAWAPDNDLLGGKRDRGAWLRESRQRTRGEAERDQEGERAGWREEEARARRPKREPREKRHHESPSTKTSHADRPSEPKLGARDAPPMRVHKGPLRRVSRSSPFITEIDPSVPIEKGTRVRVLAGPFVGKVGIVQALDGKGGARVMLGLLAARVDVKDLVASAEGRERPALASSHRKPLLSGD